MRQPPRIALALLQRHASEELVGDLIEGHRHGRSRLWFWRQTVFALALTTFTEARAHKVLTLRGIVVGWAAYALLAYPVMSLIRVFLTDVVGIPFLKVYGDPPELSLTLAIIGAFLASCVVGRMQHRARLASVTAFALTVVAPAAQFAFSVLPRVVVYDWVTQESRGIHPLWLIAFPVAMLVAMMVGGTAVGATESNRRRYFGSKGISTSA